MAVPVRKASEQKRRSRRGYIRLTVPAVHYDAATGEYHLSHRASLDGYYKGHQIIKEANSDN